MGFTGTQDRSDVVECGVEGRTNEHPGVRRAVEINRFRRKASRAAHITVAAKNPKTIQTNILWS
jgi:hypothetical protein